MEGLTDFEALTDLSEFEVLIFEQCDGVAFGHLIFGKRGWRHVARGEGTEF
jgi:hypothetical protein